MNDKLCLGVCAHFRRDIESALESLGEEDIRIHSFTPSCTLHPGRCAHARMPSTVPDGCDGFLNLLGSEPDQRPGGRGQIAHPQHCIHLLAGADLLEEATRAGAYLVTAGWLRSWRAHLRALGFDQDRARLFFQECARELLLLDTGTDPEAHEALHAFADVLDLPRRIQYVGLDVVRLRLELMIQRWRNERNQGRLRAVLAQTNHKVADYAMAFDLLVRLSHLSDEETTVNAIHELFTMLFGCTNLVYAWVTENRVERVLGDALPQDQVHLQQVLDEMEVGDLVLPAGTGFYVRIDHQRVTSGLLWVRELPFPGYRDQYMNLSAAIARLCGLAISNARTFAVLQKTERSLRQERDRNVHLLQQVRILADTDPLTNLYNRRRFSTLAEAAFHEAKQHGFVVSVIMLDLDHFKRVNDTHGHAVGDQVLVEFARRLRDLSIPGILARYGGEEFIALCPRTDAEAAARLAARMLQALAERPIETTAGPLTMTASLGVARLADEVRTLDALIHRADIAMYLAKSAGRARVAVYAAGEEREGV
ncbi:diguanylate cyclase [Thiocapsa imhoffii]